MRTTLRVLAAFALLFAAVQASAAVTFVNGYGLYSNVNTISYSPSAGHFIAVASMTSGGAGDPTATITDNLSDTWTTGIASEELGGGWVTLFYLPNCPAGITTITITYNGGTPGEVNLSLAELAGAGSGAALATAVQYQAAPGTGADAITSGTASVGSAPAYLLGIVQRSSGHPTTAGTGYTAEFTSGDAYTFIEDQTVSSTGSYAATATDATFGATNNYTTYEIAVAPASAAAASPVISNGHVLMSNGHPVISGILLPGLPLAWIIDRRTRVARVERGERPPVRGA